MSKSRMKSMLIVFVDKNGVVHSTTTISHLTPASWLPSSWQKNNIVTIPQPPYSPDLAQQTFSSSLKVKPAPQKAPPRDPG
ncbi:hypothetical protein TNCV_2463161 [Trichonephila clavipes]|nr:hypothetical protein TNCV_2463161 [Trichonephila clavipes]